ncbi:phosphatidate cytidylyltransferase [Candidatus Pelagibacter sp.]|nr:phosphatidate cytidylyltransferase [Candidatus Pelagibacter sp.]
MNKKELQKRILSSFVLLPVVFFFIIQGSIYFVLLLSVILLVISYEWINMNNKNLFKILGLLYFSLTVYLTYKFSQIFYFQFILVLIICILTDLGGYVFGKTLKGPKLIKISPNKTYSGLIGSLIFSILGAFIYVAYTSFGKSSYLEIQYLLSKNDIQNSSLHFVIIILNVSILSQIGDLIISYFKRKSKVKDTGNLIPGHGGLLDRIDGIIFAMPITFIFFNILNQ